MRRISKCVATGVLAAALLTGPSSSPLGARNNPALDLAAATAEAGDVATPVDPLDFTLKDMDGHAVKVSTLRGRPVIIDFWASWCPPCRKQIPELNKIYDRYHRSDGLAVIGVACDTIEGDGIKAVRPFVKELAITYLVLIAEEPVIDRFGVDEIPTTLFISRDGQLVGRLTGAGHPEKLHAAVNSLLQRPKSQK